MEEQKNSVTKGGGLNTSKNDIFAITFKTYRENEVCGKGVENLLRRRSKLSDRMN